jgi:hypothetical protein
MGMLMALNLRAFFYDHMFLRARQMAPARGRD